MVGPWMLFSQNRSHHGCHHGWGIDGLCSDLIRPWTHGRHHGCSLLRTDETMDVIVVGPWMLSSQNGSDHGRHHAWAMDVLLSERNRP